MVKTFKIIFAGICSLLLLVSCAKELPEEVAGSETYIVESSQYTGTKVELDGLVTVWTEGDLLSVFRSTVNEKYAFDGETGDVRGTISKDDETVPGAAFAKSYAIYPWAESTSCTTEGTVNYTFPSTVTYKEGSFAIGSNVMIASTADAIDNRLSFANVCGWIELKIYGSSACQLQSIRLYGNGGEKLSGAATIDAQTLEVTMLPAAKEDVTLQFSTPFALQSEATVFWLAIPPTTFTDGFTVELTTDKGKSKTKSTSSSVSVGRNHAVPMKAMTPNTYSDNEKVFVLYGDSITPKSVRTKLQELLDADGGESIAEDGFSVVRNSWKVVLAGVSGEYPLAITARQGGAPLYLQGGFTIPASGSVTVGSLYSTWNAQAVVSDTPSTKVTFNYGAESTSSTYTGCSNPFLVNGVQCTYNGSTLTRVTAGDPVVCDGETVGSGNWVRVYPCASWKYRDAYFSTYQGTNGSYNRTPAQGGNTYEVLSRFYDAETEYSTSKKHIIVGYHNPRWTLDCTTYFKSKCGSQYFDMKEWMLTRYEEIEELLGIPLSDDDKARIAAGNLPLAWQSSSDTIHLTTPVGYSAYACCIYRKFKRPAQRRV